MSEVRSLFSFSNKRKMNVIGWRCRQRQPASQVAFFSVRANKFTKWKTGFSNFYGLTKKFIYIESGQEKLVKEKLIEKNLFVLHTIK